VPSNKEGGEHSNFFRGILLPSRLFTTVQPKNKAPPEIRDALAATAAADFLVPMLTVNSVHGSSSIGRSENPTSTTFPAPPAV